MKDLCPAHQEALSLSPMIPATISPTQNRREAAADGNKCFGVSGVQPEIRFGQNELRAFAQRHSDRLSGRNAELFCGDGFGKDHAGALVAVTADGGGNETKIWLSVRYAPRGFPG